MGRRRNAPWLSAVLCAVCGCGSGVSEGSPDAASPPQGDGAGDPSSVDSLSTPDAPTQDATGPQNQDGASDAPAKEGGPAAPTDAGAGLSTLHCGDNVIENDPDVVFVEKFDEGSIAGASARWDPNPDNPQAMSLSTMAPPGSRTVTSAKWHYESTGAFTVGFVKTLAGFDQLWFRYYVNIAAAGDPIWHFFRMGGGTPFGGANQKPDGTDRFATAVEPNYTRQKWDFYTYWMDMRSDSAGNNYGNNFLGEDFRTCKDLAPPVATGKWVAVELMVKVNSVGLTDGEQAFWIDGQPILSNYSGTASPQVISVFRPGSPLGGWITAHFCPDTKGLPFSGDPTTPSSGFRWRTAAALNISYIRPIVYNDHAQPNPANDVYVANIVVARKPIGPIVPCQ